MILANWSGNQNSVRKTMPSNATNTPRAPHEVMVSSTFKDYHVLLIKIIEGSDFNVWS